jgi:hypothetical protein
MAQNGTDTMEKFKKKFAFGEKFWANIAYDGGD